MALLLPSSRCCTSRMATVSPKLTLNPSNTPCGSAASLTFRTLSSLLSRTTKKGTFDACYDESHPTSGKARGAIGSFPYLYGRRRQRRQHEFEWEKILLSDPNHRHRTSSPNSQLSHRTAVLPSAVSLQHQNEMSMPTSSPAAIFYPFNATKDTTALTLSRFVQEIPRQLVLRKRMNVTAGSPQDPVTSLMR